MLYLRHVPAIFAVCLGLAALYIGWPDGRVPVLATSGGQVRSVLYEADIGVPYKIRLDEFWNYALFNGDLDFVELLNSPRGSKDEIPGPAYTRYRLVRDRVACNAAPRHGHGSLLPGSFISDSHMLRGECILGSKVDQPTATHALESDGGSAFVRRRESQADEATFALDALPRAMWAALGGSRPDWVGQYEADPAGFLVHDDASLIKALQVGRNLRRAALRVIGLRSTSTSRSERLDYLPEVRVSTSPVVVDALLATFEPQSDSDRGDVAGLHLLISGASPVTAESIYPRLIERGYTVTSPTWRFEFGNRWREQIRARRPQLVATYDREDTVPLFAHAAAWRAMNNVLLRMGQPYIDRFVEEFKPHFLESIHHNSGSTPSLHVVARSRFAESFIENLLDSRYPLTPARLTRRWILVLSQPHLSAQLTARLAAACEGDADFWSDDWDRSSWVDDDGFCDAFRRKFKAPRAVVPQ